MNPERIKNIIRTELNPVTAEEKRDSKIAFFVATVIIASAGITGLLTGNIGGYVALGAAALSALKTIAI
jgi:hypothetical protein